MAKRLVLVCLLSLAFVACRSKGKKEGKRPSGDRTEMSATPTGSSIENSLESLLAGLALRLDLNAATDKRLHVAQVHLLDDLILLESNDPRPRLYAFNRADMDAAWVTMIQEASVFPAAENPDTIYLLSGHMVHALRSLTGERTLRASHGLALPYLLLPFTPTAGIAAQMDTFYVPSLGSPDNNKTLESFSGITSQRGWGFRSQGNIRNTPKIGGGMGDPKLYFMTDKGKIVSIDAKTYGYRPQGTLWEVFLDDRSDYDFFLTADTKTRGGALYVTDRTGAVYCIDRITGERRWVNQTGRSPRGGPQVFGDVCVVPMDDGLYGYDTNNVLYDIRVVTGEAVKVHTLRAGDLMRVGGGSKADIDVGGEDIAMTLEVQGEVLIATGAGDEEAVIEVNGRAVGSRAALHGGDKIRVHGSLIEVVDRGSSPLWKRLSYERAVCRVGNGLVVANGTTLSVVDARTGAVVTGPVALPGARLIPTNTKDGTIFVVGGDAVLYSLMPR